MFVGRLRFSHSRTGGGAVHRREKGRRARCSTALLKSDRRSQPLGALTDVGDHFLSLLLSRRSVPVTGPVVRESR